MDCRTRVSPAWALPLVLLAACSGGYLPEDGGTPGADGRAPDTRPGVDVPTPPPDIPPPPDVPPPPPDVVCAGTQTNCAGVCADLMTDDANCGTCGTRCPSGQRCTAGACAAICPPGMTTCAGSTACLDLMSSHDNCGTCGHACGASEMCAMGACVPLCPSPMMLCTAGGTTSCVDLTSSHDNCGACGMACSATRMCVGGACACPTGQTDCAGACVDTTTDSANCGACGMACPAGSSCAGSMCVCPAGQTLCAGRCVTTATDPSNCGACGRACAAGMLCSGGACGCTAGLTACGAACVNTSTDVNNCGACGRVCPAGNSCVLSTCTPPPPANDSFASAVTLSLGAAETVVSGTTLGASRDGTTVACGCTSAGNVWYRFTLTEPTVVYVDTAGSGYDTSVWITDTAGTPVPAQTANGQSNAGLCNDDGGCGVTGGFTSSLQSRTWGDFAAGTYYIAVSGCGTGNFTLRVQRIAHSIGSYFYGTRFTGDTTTATFLVGTSRMTSACGGTASGEDVRWFVTCGAQEFFSLCASDGGTWLRRNAAGTNFDPSMYIRSGQTGGEVVCNDDGGSMGGTNCVGTGGDTLPYGSRLNNVTVPRGLNALFVDERTGGSGMSYTLRYTVR